MRKIVAILLLAAVLACAVGIGAGAVSLGSGIEAMASGIELVKTGITGERITFSDGDFKSAFAVSDFKSVTVTALPSEEEGTLIAAGKRVKEGQVIKRRNLGSLIFVPSGSGVAEASFRFVLNGAGTGTETVCRMRFIDRVNGAPTVPEDSAASGGLTTQAGIPLYARLAGTDPEGDEIRFMIVGFPKNGAVRLTDDTVGAIEYTPEADFVGYDELVYVVRDGYGNYSAPATVSLRVIERMSDVVFADMAGRSEYSAAVALSAMGVMNGVKRGGVSYFEPDNAVTRAEFVAMALRACGVTPTGVGISFFDDDAEIPRALVAYVAYAARHGIVDGDFGEGGLLFRPNDVITAREAAVIMARLVGADSSGEEEIFVADASIPSWAVTSVYAMFTLGIFDGDAEDFRADEPLDRATVAGCLYRLISLG